MPKTGVCDNNGCNLQVERWQDAIAKNKNIQALRNRYTYVPQHIHLRSARASHSSDKLKRCLQLLGKLTYTYVSFQENIQQACMYASRQQLNNITLGSRRHLLPKIAKTSYSLVNVNRKWTIT